MSIRKPQSERAGEPADLRAERETFVRNFLHKGVELTEALIRDNRGLEAELHKVQEENVRLRSQLASNDAIRELLNSIETLQQERRLLLSRSTELENQRVQGEERQNAIEQELNDLASLYVASFQLSATLSAPRVVRHICELLEQLVGAKSFVVYVLSADGKQATPIGARGHGQARLPILSAEDGPFGDVCLTGVQRTLAPEAVREPGEPLVLLPLVFDGDVVGVISIDALLPHKRAWARVDEELFKLLSILGATALIAANLYERQLNPRAALEGVLDYVDDKPVAALGAKVLG